MFDLMGAIQKRQQEQAPPPADSAETAETPQPRGAELAESVRKIADSLGGDIFPAIIRNNPQTPKTVTPASIKDFRDLSANPQSPQSPQLPGDQGGQNPNTLLLEIAQTLEASPARLRALLSADDMQDIAEGATNRAHLLAYFRLMRSDGHTLADGTLELTRAPQSRLGRVERMQAWKPAHDAMINHLMTCSTCYAPQGQYCAIGTEFRRAYRRAC